MKRYSYFVLIICLILLFATQLSYAGDLEPITITIGHVSPPTVPYTFGAEKFGEYLNLLLDRKINVEIYPGGELAAFEGEAFEMLQDGLMDVSWSSTGNLASFVPEVQFTDLPFLFEDINHVNRVVRGEVGKAILNKVEEKTGIKALAYHEDAWKVITSKEPINSFQDMEGLKIRAMTSPIYIDLYQAMNANPTPIQFSELYSSLQLGVVDAQDNGILHSEPAGFFEVQDAVAMLHHYWNAGMILMSKQCWEKFTEEEKPLVRKAAIIAGEIQRRMAWEKEKALVNELKQKGITVTYPDLEPFKESVEVVYDKWLEKYPIWAEWYEKVKEAR